MQVWGIPKELCRCDSNAALRGLRHRNGVPGCGPPWRWPHPPGGGGGSLPLWGGATVDPLGCIKPVHPLHRALTFASGVKQFSGEPLRPANCRRAPPRCPLPPNQGSGDLAGPCLADAPPPRGDRGVDIIFNSPVSFITFFYYSNHFSIHNYFENSRRFRIRVFSGVWSGFPHVAASCSQASDESAPGGRNGCPYRRPWKRRPFPPGLTAEMRGGGATGPRHLHCST